MNDNEYLESLLSYGALYAFLAVVAISVGRLVGEEWLLHGLTRNSYRGGAVILFAASVAAVSAYVFVAGMEAFAPHKPMVAAAVLSFAGIVILGGYFTHLGYNHARRDKEKEKRRHASNVRSFP